MHRYVHKKNKQKISKKNNKILFNNNNNNNCGNGKLVEVYAQ